MWAKLGMRIDGEAISRLCVPDFSDWVPLMFASQQSSWPSPIAWDRFRSLCDKPAAGGCSPFRIDEV